MLSIQPHTLTPYARLQMTLIGYCITCLLRDTADASIMSEVVKVATLMPKEFGVFIALNNCVPSVVRHLEDVLVGVVEVKVRARTYVTLIQMVCLTHRLRSWCSSQDLKATYLLSPLQVLKALCDAGASPQIKSLVFPAGGEYEGLIIDKTEIHPADAPKHTLRCNLIKCMTSSDTNVKRLSSELLWALCGSDGGEFCKRVGWGNACWWFSVMGVIKVPGM